MRLTNANGYTDSSEYRINVVMAPPHAPRDLTATSGSFPDRVRISWSPVSGANSYDVYRSVDWTFAAASRIALDLSSTTFDDLDVDEGELFYYWVISKGAGGSSLPGGPNSGRISLETPASLSQLDASNGTERNSIRLNWDRPSNAISYDVFRSASERFEEAVLLGSTHTTEWLDMEHAAPGSYFYWVRARNPDREGAPTVSALSETGHSTPDVWVISREGNLTGSGSHSAKDGISTAGIHLKSFSGVSYTTYVKNEGSMTDSYLISIRTSKTDLVTTHIDRSTGFNISAALITGTWKSDSVSPGEMRAILSTTKPSGRLARSKRRSFNSLGMVTGQAELSFPAPDSVGLRFSFVRKIRKGSNRK